MCACVQRVRHIVPLARLFLLHKILIWYCQFYIECHLSQSRTFLLMQNIVFLVAISSAQKVAQLAPLSFRELFLVLHHEGGSFFNLGCCFCQRCPVKCPVPRPQSQRDKTIQSSDVIRAAKSRKRRGYASAFLVSSWHGCNWEVYITAGFFL